MLDKIIYKIRRQPVLLSQAAALIISGLAAFGLDLTKEQSAWIAGVAVFLAALVGFSQVTPNVSVAAKQPAPEEPTVAGPASDVKAGDEVDVVPTDPLAQPSQDYPQTYGSKSEAASYDPKHDRP